MTLYDRIWTGFAGLVGAVAIIAVLRGFPLVAVLGIFFIVGVLGSLWVVPFLHEDGPVVKPLVLGGLLTGLLGWLLLGAGHLAGNAGLLVVAVAVLTCPALTPTYRLAGTRLGWASKLARRRPATQERLTRAPSSARGKAGRVSAGGPVVDPAADLQPLDVPDLMSDADLCQAWRSSFVALERATSVESRLRVVRVRALYLDELERRAGPAVQAWLGSGARAASDPSRFLTRGRRQRPPSLAE